MCERIEWWRDLRKWRGKLIELRWGINYFIRGIIWRSWFFKVRVNDISWRSLRRVGKENWRIEIGRYKGN